MLQSFLKEFQVLRDGRVEQRGRCIDMCAGWRIWRIPE